MTAIQAPYGSWRSPITSDLIVAETIGLSEPRFDGEDVYWLENRPGTQPNDKARIVIVRCAGGKTSDVFGSSYSARDTVHEYGGGAYCVADGIVYFSSFFDDEQLYVTSPGGTPKVLTSAKGFRYADSLIDRERKRLVCVRENHNGNTVKNEIVGISLNGGTSSVLVTGNDFYSSPRISADGTQIAWLTWNFPEMPWTNTQLWVGRFDAAGSVTQMQQVAGTKSESIFQPEWSPDGILYFVSDIDGWWNLYRWKQANIEQVTKLQAEFGQAQWFFGMSTYAFESVSRLICSFTSDGLWSLAELDTNTLKLTPFSLPYRDISYVRAKQGLALFCAGSPQEELAVVRLDLNTTSCTVLKRSFAQDPTLAPYLSAPQTITFPTSRGKSAHAFYYAPKNPDFSPKKGDLPPLLLKSHGGPTAATSSTLDLRIQYWTSRGFAVVDVNYGGSTGYGREYRFRLKGKWGVVDLDDCVNAAGYLCEQKQVDRTKLAISGGSAGGYTTLCALTFRKRFRAGASYYGIGDLEKLAQDTHKFESHYMDWLIGPYPKDIKVYKKRSPINSVTQLQVPVIFFQGEDDKIVPPNQSAAMAEALRKRKVPFGYFLFKGEQHGFRNGQNIKRALDAELYFYAVHLFREGLRF